MEILAVNPVNTTPFIFVLLGIFSIAMTAASFVFIFVSIAEERFIASIVFLILFIIGVTGISYSFAEERKTFKYDEYKVTIDETVNAREFLNQYEILSREGEIFTIKEIEVDE